MGDLTRRNQPTPVDARRRPPEATPEATIVETIVEVPGAAPAQAGQPAPPANLTQNIFYISAPAPVAQGSAPSPPAAPASPPPEVHYHTTVHHTAPTRGPRRGLSFFGTAALVLGGLGCAANYLPQAAMFVKPLAMAGLTAGGLGLLGAILRGRAGKGIPFLGLLVSAVALGLWLQKNDPRVRAEVEKLKDSVPQLDLVIPAKPATKAPAPARAQAPPPVKVDEPSKKDTSVFSFERASTLPPPVASAPRPIVESATSSLALAYEKLEQARFAAAGRMGLDYTAAKATAAKAAAELEQARLKHPVGSEELLAANQSRMAANTALNAMINRLYKDAEVTAAEQSLKRAQASHVPALK